jgi:hypothetical protein
MPPERRRDSVRIGSILPSVELVHVTGSHTLFYDWKTPEDKKTFWWAFVIALQMFAPGLFTSPKQLKLELRNFIKNCVTDKQFLAVMDDCTEDSNNGRTGDCGSRTTYTAFLARAPLEGDDVIPGDIKLLVHFLRNQTPFPGRVCIFQVYNSRCTVIDSEFVRSCVESSIKTTDVVLVSERPSNNVWVAAEARPGMIQLW